MHHFKNHQKGHQKSSHVSRFFKVFERLEKAGWKFVLEKSWKTSRRAKIFDGKKKDGFQNLTKNHIFYELKWEEKKNKSPFGPLKTMVFEAFWKTSKTIITLIVFGAFFVPWYNGFWWFLEENTWKKLLNNNKQFGGR